MVAVVQIVVEFHVAEGHESVEQSVGHRLNGLIKTLARDAGLNRPSLMAHDSGKRPAADQYDILCPLHS